MIKNNFKQIHVRLSEKIYKELKVKCIYEDTSIQQYLSRLINDDLDIYSKKRVSI
jgi:hypothetical protein